MQRIHFTRTLTILLCAAGLLTAGCESFQGGGNRRSMIDTEIVAQPEAIVDAAKQAIKQHEGLVLISSRSGALDGHVTGRTARDETVDVFVNSRTEDVTSVSVRIGGGGGNQSIALNILDTIRQQVGQGGSGSGGSGSGQYRGQSGSGSQSGQSGRRDQSMNGGGRMQDQERRMEGRRRSGFNSGQEPVGSDNNDNEDPAMFK